MGNKFTYSFGEFMVIVMECELFYILTLPILLLIVALIWIALTVTSYPFYLLFSKLI
jgi:hypothetical protein|nr:MAG TPA: hypothetical protein [Caudoviricetes sp.]